jgi:hypothetical protein
LSDWSCSQPTELFKQGIYKKWFEKSAAKTQRRLSSLKMVIVLPDKIHDIEPKAMSQLIATHFLDTGLTVLKYKEYIRNKFP